MLILVCWNTSLDPQLLIKSVFPLHCLIVATCHNINIDHHMLIFYFFHYLKWTKSYFVVGLRTAHWFAQPRRVPTLSQTHWWRTCLWLAPPLRAHSKSKQEVRSNSASWGEHSRKTAFLWTFKLEFLRINLQIVQFKYLMLWLCDICEELA